MNIIIAALHPRVANMRSESCPSGDIGPAILAGTMRCRSDARRGRLPIQSVLVAARAILFLWASTCGAYTSAGRVDRSCPPLNSSLQTFSSEEYPYIRATKISLNPTGANVVLHRASLSAQCASKIEPFDLWKAAPLKINLIGGWMGMLAGVISGALIGLFFHRDNWMGGYGSFSRRLTRLGHISFFGIGFLNLLFVATSNELLLPAGYLEVASSTLIIGAVSMPLCCFLSAWHKSLRHLFPVPVAALATGIFAILIGWWQG